MVDDPITTFPLKTPPPPQPPMFKLNKGETVVEKVAESVVADEIREKIAKLAIEEDKNKINDPIAEAKEVINAGVSAKEKSSRLASNKKSHQEKAIAKNVETYLDRSNKHLLERPVFVADKGGKDGVILIGTTKAPELWVPDAKVDVQKNPIIVTLDKRMIMEQFVRNFKTVPEHFKIDHLNVQDIYSGTTFDEFMTVSLIIDDFYWNSFTERVPKDIRGFHIGAGKEGINVIENNGFHTLEMTVRMSVTINPGVEPTKKQLQQSYKATAASLFTDFKIKNQILLTSHCRSPGEVSYPIRIADEHIIPARNIEDGEEVTDSGVILTPLKPMTPPVEHEVEKEHVDARVATPLFSPKPTHRKSDTVVITGDKEIICDDDKDAAFHVIENKIFDIKMVGNMDYFIGNKIPKAAADLAESVEKLSEGVKVGADPTMVAMVKSLQTSLDELKEALTGMKVDHKVSFDFKSVFSTAFDGFLSKIKFMLPTDPIQRDVVIGLIVGVIYLWAVKNKYKKFIYLGLALATAVSYWTENSHLTTFFGTLFGIHSAIDIFTVVREMFSSEEDNEEVVENEIDVPMGGNSILSAVSKSYVPSVLVGAIITFVFSTIINVAPNPYHVIGDITIFKQILNGLEFTIQVFADCFIQLVNAISSPWGVKIFRSCYTKFPEAFVILDGFNSIKDKFLEGARVSKADYDRFKYLVRALDELDKKIPKRADMRVYTSQVDFMKRLQGNLEDRFKIMGIISGGIRAAPYVVTIKSDAGYGKSILTHGLMNALAPLILSASEYEEYKIDKRSFLCTVDPGAEYHENIKPGHVMYIVDDFMQMKNKNADPKICHARWLTKVNNNAESVVNKAFGDKGTVYDGPLAMVMGTNIKSLADVEDQMSTNNKNTPARRMGDVWSAHIAEEFRQYIGDDGTYKLDESKVDGIETSFYTFEPDTYLTANNGRKATPAISKTVSYIDWVKISALRYLSHHCHQEIILGQIAETHNNPKLTPWPGMTGLEIAMSLAQEDFDPVAFPNKFKSSVDIIKMVVDKGLSDELAAEIQKYVYRPWLPVLEQRTPKFIATFVSMMTEPLLLSMIHKVKEIKEMKSDEIIVELEYWQKKYSKLTAVEIAAKENAPVPQSIYESFSEKKKNFINCFKGMADVEPMYDSHPEFFDHFMENQNNYLAWITGSSLPLALDANVRILGSRLVNPIENMDLVWHAIRQTFVAVCATARRVAMTPICVIEAAYKAETWANFIKDPFMVISNSVTNFVIDMKNYGSDIYNSLAYGLPFSHEFTAAISAAVLFFVGTQFTDVLELVANSIIKVKYHPKLPKVKSNVKTATVAPVVHHIPNNAKVEVPGKSNADYLASENIEMLGDARFWNEQVQAVENAYMANQYTLVLNDAIVSSAVFQRDWTFMVHDHTAKMMLDACVPGTTFQLIDAHGVPANILFGNCDVVRFPGVDYALITINKSQLGAKADIVKKHVTQAQLTELQTVPSFDGLLLYCVKSKTGDRIMKHIPVKVDTKYMTYTTKETTYKDVPMLVYSIEGHPSSCMSGLLVCDTRFKDINGIIGYHSAGNLNSGDCTSASRAVTKEMLEEMLGHVKEQKGLPSVAKIPMGPNCQIPLGIDVVGVQEALTQSLYGKIVKTPFYGFMHDEDGAQVPYNKRPSICMPYSIMADDEEVTHWPYYNVLETCVNESPAINAQICSYARAMYTHTWNRSVIEPGIPFVLSTDQAINGWDLIGPDSRKSSVGQELRYRGITKLMMYGPEGERNLNTPLMEELCSEIEDDLAMLKRGEEPDWKFLFFIKSELTSEKKILEGNFRGICGVDWKEHIICKRLFGYVLNLAVKNKIRNGMLMGMNPYSEDIDVIGKILEVFKLLCDGDYQKFDKRFFTWLFEEFATFLRGVYWNAPEEEHRARELILAKLLHPDVIVIVYNEDGEPIALVVKLKNVLPSGHTLTQFLGGFGNGLMGRYSYLIQWCKSIGTTHLAYDVKIHPKPDIAYEEENMHMFVLGDDNIMAFIEERYGFNCISNQENMAEIGVVYTPSDKSPKFLVKWRRLGEAGILKRVIHYDEEEGRYIADIEENSIIGALYYTECMRTLNQTIDTMLQEAAIKGRVYHTRFVYYLKRRANEIEYMLVSPYLDYDIARAFVFNTAYLPWGEMTTEIVDETAVLDN